MTTQMIITVAITVLMIAVIMMDKLPFGAPPIVACSLLVVTGCATIEEAFSGFVDKNVIMIAGFLCVMAAFQKTSAIEKIRATLYKMAGKGGYRNYVLMLILIMVGAMLISGTAYYVLVLSLVATIPYNEKLPNSKLVAPLGFATYFSIFPLQYAMFYGIMGSVLESCGVSGVTIPLSPYLLLCVLRSLAFFVWALVGFKLLPSHDISEGAVKEETVAQETSAPKLSAGKEKLVYAVMIATIVSLLFLNKIGERGYAIPAVGASILLCSGVLNFKEYRNNICSPMVLMLAGVIGVATALSNSGFTNMVGTAIATSIGASLSPFWMCFIFALLTSICATFTGASFGSLYIFAPIAISTAVALGYNPIALAVSLCSAAWINWFMPIDGMPAMVMGIGKYKLTDFWKFTIPLWLIQILVVATACTIFYPM